MKKYRFKKDITIYEDRSRVLKSSPTWTTFKPDKYEYKWDFKKGDPYEGADRTEFGSWLLEMNLIEEVEDG